MRGASSSIGLAFEMRSGRLFGGVLGEDWLFGQEGPAKPRRGAKPARSAEEAAGGAWQELETAWKKVKQLNAVKRGTSETGF